MAPLVSLCRATGRPAAALTSSRRRSSIRRTVAAHATTDDSPNAALLTLSAGALLAQSAVVDSAAAAQLSRAPEQGVVAASQVHASQSDKFASTTAPAVHLDASNISRTNSGPEANMDDPDAYFDQVDRMEGRTAPSPAVRFVHIHGGYVEAAVPAPVLGELADQNADVRDVAKNYRDPAGAIQQDKFADKVKSGPSLGSSDLGDSIKSGLKDAQKKATKAVSALPTPAVGDLADLNADVRGDAADYRDPAGAIQQDTAAGAVKSQLPDLSAQKATTPSAKKLGKKVVSTVTQTKRDIGVKAGYGASGSRVRDSTGKLITADDVRGTNPAIGNARLSQPLVRDSLGVKRAGSQNQTGAAGGADRKGVIEPLKEVVDRVAN